MADNLRRRGKFKEALQAAEEAIAICDRAGALPRSYPELLEVKGLTLMDMTKLEPAAQALRRAVEVEEQLAMPEWNRAFTLVALGQVTGRLKRLDEAIGYLEKAMRIWTMETEPVYHGATALVTAEAVAWKGRAHWPRACELARVALKGYTSPTDSVLTMEINATKKFLAEHKCGKG